MELLLEITVISFFTVNCLIVAEGIILTILYVKLALALQKQPQTRKSKHNSQKS